MMTDRLSAAQLHTALLALNRDSEQPWQLSQGKLYKELRFADFAAAFAFMTELADYAERHQHHPEWFNVYNKVQIYLVTHEVGGVSQRDLAMARHIDALLRRR